MTAPAQRSQPGTNDAQEENWLGLAIKFENEARFLESAIIDDADRSRIRNWRVAAKALRLGAAAPVPQRDGEPVAWRWRHVNSDSPDWNYQDQPVGNHNEYIRVEPLYAAPARYDARLQRLSYDAQTFHRVEAEKALQRSDAVTADALSDIIAEHMDKNYGWDTLSVAQAVLRALSPSSNGKPATENEG